MTNRMIRIFKAIVEEYIATNEPVGSKNLMIKYDLPYSSATIRNDMAYLEEIGFLEKPYTSAGRIPSRKGYRYYCEHLIEEKIDPELKLAISDIFASRNLSIEDAVKESIDVISKMTNLTTGLLGPEASSLKLRHIQLFKLSFNSAVCVFITSDGHSESKIFNFRDDIAIEDIENCVSILNDNLQGSYLSDLYNKLESLRPLLAKRIIRSEILFNAFANAFIKFKKNNVYFSSTANITAQPEYNDVRKLKKLLKILDSNNLLIELNDNNEHAFNIDENTQLCLLDDLSVVTSNITLWDDQNAKLMVVGPNRMDYDRVIWLMNYIADEIRNRYRKE